MSLSKYQKTSADLLHMMREKNPLVHNITNFVVMNFSANVLLAAGASPVMAHAPEEMEEMAAIAGALVLNIGTLSKPWIESMLIAGKTAAKLGIPVILDPVGAGATKMRTETALRIIEEVGVTAIRGNASEIMALGKAEAATKGVDSVHKVTDAAEIAKAMAKEIKGVVAVTGAVDLVTDGEKSIHVAGGHPLMGKVTGTGCGATAVMGAFLAMAADPLQSCMAALAYYGLAGALAAKKAQAPGSYCMAFIDSLYEIEPGDLNDVKISVE